MKLLLHTCCAPCAIYPVSEAKKESFTITGFFCNSNIHPQAEYVKRKETARDFFKSEGLELFFPTYDPDSFMSFLSPRKRGKQESIIDSRFRGNDRNNRCSICWSVRLRETAFFAKNNGLDAFTTTLLGSPYQDHDMLKKICENLSRKEKVRFYYKDFRVGFRDAHNLARKRGIYCQKYCGCVFSIVEKDKAKKAVANRH